MRKRLRSERACHVPQLVTLRRTLALGVLLAAAVTGGCIRPARAVAVLPAGEWATRTGDAAHAAFAHETVPETVDIIWDVAVGRGLPAQPIVHGDLIIAVISGGGIQTLSASNARRYWGRRFRGAIADQALRIADRIYFATHQRGGTVYALDLSRGRRIWSRDLDARAATDPVHADGMLYVPTDRGEMVALQAASGRILWRTPLHATAAQPPVVAGDELLVATTRDTLVRLTRSSGTIRSRHPLGGTASAPLALRGDTLVAALFPGSIAAFDDLGARLLWRHDLGEAILAAPAIDDDGIYALTRVARLYRVGRSGAERLADLGGAATESMTLVANGVVVGRLDGSVTFLTRDGRTVWQHDVPGSVRAPAAVRDGSVYVATLSGRLIRLGR